MDQLFWTLPAIQQLLLAEVAAFLLLLAVLRLARAVKTRWKRSRPVTVHRAEVPAAPPQQAQPTAPVIPPAQMVGLMAAAAASPTIPELTEVTASQVPPPGVVSRPVARPVPRVRPKGPAQSDLPPDALLGNAQAALAAGATEAAADQLRQCIRLAAKLKQPAIEAQARLVLGDVARASGDHTTACEHWQMARELFSRLQKDDDRLATEHRMERAGCPTDWVLTQF